MEINVGDIVRAEVRKADVKQEAGLKLEQRSNGNIYIRKVDGLFKRRNVPVQVGDRLHTINGKDVEDYPGGLNEIKALIQREMKIWIAFERVDETEEDDSLPKDVEEEEDDDDEVLLLEGPEPLLQLEYKPEDEDDEESEEEEEEEEVLRLTNGPKKEDVLKLTNGSTTTSGSGGLKKGMEMRLFKLKKKPKLNGTIVEIVGPGKSRGRWEVKVLRHPLREANAGAILSISEENLKEL